EYGCCCKDCVAKYGCYCGDKLFVESVRGRTAGDKDSFVKGRIAGDKASFVRGRIAGEKISETEVSDDKGLGAKDLVTNL
ncbi:14900_t:CDS:1, partial [Gigaspora margarita]